MKPRIKEVIIVEGKYDKNALLQVVDATIIETDGFGIFRNDKKLKLLRTLARERGLILFTDSDGAGFVIRNHIKSAIPANLLKQAYAPDIYGKEKRKATKSKEGKIGVEGMPKDILLKSLADSGATFDDINVEKRDEITKADFFDRGLIGDGSKFKREALIKKLDLPNHISSNALLELVNIIYTRDEFLLLEF